MSILSNDLETRKKEAENFIEYINKLENLEHPEKEQHSIMFSPIDLLLLNTSMKASVFLILYNVIESTTTSCLNLIHTEIIHNELKYSELNSSIKKIVLTYYYNAINKNNDVVKTVDFKYNQLEFMGGRTNFNITFNELSQYYQMYSGNLDAKQIRNILLRYGIDFTNECAELKTIKDKRNKLAHGILSFEEVGRDLPIQYIKVLKDRAFVFLNDMTSVVEKYIEQKSYKD